MIQSPILKVLSSMRTHQVQCLLMGGQACVLYGAAEFSRDTDLAVLADLENIDRLKSEIDNRRELLFRRETWDYVHHAEASTCERLSV